MISAVSSIIMLCSSNKANRCEPSTSWPSSCLIVVRSCFMSSCIRAITHLGLHIVALKVFEMSSLLNFHVCWYAHFILILLTQTAGDTSVNKKAANVVSRERYKWRLYKSKIKTCKISQIRKLKIY